MMVNYLYDLDTIDANTGHYSQTSEATLSKELKQLAGKNLDKPERAMFAKK